MLEGVLWEGALVGVEVATELVLVHGEGVAALTGDWVARAGSRQIGHSRLDKGVDVEHRVIAVVVGQVEGQEEWRGTRQRAGGRVQAGGRVGIAALVNTAVVVEGIRRGTA